MSKLLEKKGDECVSKASKILKKFIYFGDRNQDAITFLIDAIKFYKLCKNNCKVLNVYDDIIKLETHEQSLLITYIDASNIALTINDYDKAIYYLEKIIDYYVGKGNLSICGEFYEKLGKIYEDINNFEFSSENYQIASKYYNASNNKSIASKILFKAAELCPDYQKAAEIFKQNIELCGTGFLMNSIVQTIFNYILCKIYLGDLILSKNLIKKYGDTNIEYKYLEIIVLSIEYNDINNFLLIFSEINNNNNKFNKWQKNLILKIKEKFMEKL